MWAVKCFCFVSDGKDIPNLWAAGRRVSRSEVWKGEICYVNDRYFWLSLSSSRKNTKSMFGEKPNLKKLQSAGVT